MPGIFISYRRSESETHARLLCESVKQRFPGVEIFIDVDNIQPGENFPQAINEALTNSQALLAVIGPAWLKIIQERAESQTEDFVRQEIETALRLKVEIIPILVDGARMPDATGLPETLKPLAYQNALDLTHKRFPFDIQRLADRLKALGIDPIDLAAMRADYLAFLQSNYRVLDFKGIPQLDNFTRQLCLEDVYVPLVARPEMPEGETWERRLAGRNLPQSELPEEILALKDSGGSAPLPIEQVVAKHSRVVILGDPGSGKTTLVKHLALRLAKDPDFRIEGESIPRLPILVSLNAYAAALGQADANLQAYLPQYFAGLSQAMSGLKPLFDDAIARGQALIMLDGLDEVQEDRPRLVEKVEIFAREAAAQGNRVLVTSRIVGYRSSPLGARDWSLYTLLDFDQPAIEQFAEKWCLAFEISTLGDTLEARLAAERERTELLKALENPGVQRLASNPLLLTILALIKRQGVSLPNRRVKLYELYLETLIAAWSKARSLDRRQVGPEMDYQEILLTLAPLALWLREENPTAGLASESAILDWLTAHYTGPEWELPRGEARQRARGFLKSVHTYSNLLLERGQGQYGFIHLTIEEMLAAYGLYFKGQIRLEDSLEVIQRHLPDPAWRETLLLAVGVWGLANKQPLVAGMVVSRILSMECCGADLGQNLLVAGACLEDVGESGIGRQASQAVKAALLQAYQDRHLPPPVQRDAGFILGRIGWKPADLEETIPIPAGRFIYQGKPAEIEQPFLIAKYPVTNLQFRAFWEEKGYERKDLWSEEGWKWRTSAYDSQAEDYLKEWLARRPAEKRNQPFYWNDAKWNNPLAPVVGVSWFEAEAYCNWLSQKRGQTFRLLSEQEWERAASFSDGREYPWKGEFDRERLNCAEYWAGEEDLSDWEKWNKWYGSPSFQQASTTVVGQFPEGKSQEGICDLSGNVWEWTNSIYSKPSMVLRGGSWYGNQMNARCAFRNRFTPDYFTDNIGFRVCSPG